MVWIETEMSEQQAGILTPEQVAAIAARADAATPGPWRVAANEDEIEVSAHGWDVGGFYWQDTASRVQAMANARFNAAARANVPALVASHEALRAERDVIQVRLGDALAAMAHDAEPVIVNLERIILRAERAEQQVAALRATLAGARDVIERMIAGDKSDDWYFARDMVRRALREALRGEQ